MLLAGPLTKRCPRLRIYHAIIFFSIALVLGCGGSSATATAPPVSSANNAPASSSFGVDETPLDLLKRSTAVMETVNSFRAHVEMNMEVEGESVPTSTDMEVSRNKWMRFTTDLVTPDGEQTVEIIIADPDIYMRRSGADWFHTDLKDLAGLAGRSEQLLSDPLGLHKSLFPADDTPWELYTVSSKGREKVDGVETEHLDIQLSFQELWEQLDPETKEVFSQSFGLSGVDVGELLQQIELDFNKIDYWIDGEGYTRRTALEIMVGDIVSMNVDMRMFDINQDVKFDLPKDFSELPPS